MAWIALGISFALIILPRLVPICTGLAAGGNPMRCHYAYQAEFLVTLLALLIAGSLFVLRTAEAKLFTGFVLLLLGIIIAVLPQPWAIGTCFRGMACGKTSLFTVAGGGLLTLTGAIIVWLNYQKYRD
jgi:hypothetical protein